MLRRLRHKKVGKLALLLALVAFTSTGFCADTISPTLVPNGKVLVYQGKQIVGQLTAEAPLPEGKLLVVSGKCGVKMDGFFLVAADKSKFSVMTAKMDRSLKVKSGRVFFAISKLADPLSFVTPVGIVIARQVLLNAATGDALLKGYVDVTPKGSEIGVIEGGSMILTTSEGTQKINPGNRLLLAAAPAVGGATGGAAAGAAAGGSIVGGITAALAVPVAITAAMIGVGAANSGASNDLNPASPPPEASTFKPR